jgi:hypothetical protein
VREVPRHKLVATSLCAGPHRIAWAYEALPGLLPRRKASCLCGSPERHCAQFARGDELREHNV